MCSHLTLFIVCDNNSRMVAEINMDKKGKSHKAKSKTSEGRKQLTSVRVIQRNLVYVVGLPLNLADEDVGLFISQPLYVFINVCRYINIYMDVDILNTFLATSFYSGKTILVSTGRCRRCLYLVQLLVLFNILQTVLVVCKFDFYGRCLPLWKRPFRLCTLFFCEIRLTPAAHVFIISRFSPRYGGNLKESYKMGPNVYSLERNSLT